MAAVAQRARAEAPVARPRPAPQRDRRPAQRRRMASGVAWIVVVALLLAGVVAMNVAVLRANLRIDDLGRQRAKLRAENAALSSRLSSASTAARVEGLARARLGLVPADPVETIYVDLPGG